MTRPLIYALGFTGTQAGMSSKQVASFTRFVIEEDPDEFHHGDCVGSDGTAHAIVRMVAPRCRIIIHPPSNPSKRAFMEGYHKMMPEADYMVRNAHIVACADKLVATPRGKEELKSGTWSTVRRAREAGIDVAVLER